MCDIIMTLRNYTFIYNYRVSRGGMAGVKHFLFALLIIEYETVLLHYRAIISTDVGAQA